LFLKIGFILISWNGYSQGNKLSRQEHSEVRRAELHLNYQVQDTLLENRQFILEADIRTLIRVHKWLKLNVNILSPRIGANFYRILTNSLTVKY
jgi:hypothetical protein